MTNQPPRRRLPMLASLVIALGLSLMAFEYETSYERAFVPDWDIDDILIEKDTVIRIALKKKELRDPKPKPAPKPQPIDPDRLVDDLLDLKEINTDSLFSEEGDDSSEFVPDWIPPAVPVVQNMPYLCECEEQATDELRSECTDKLLYRHINREAKYPAQLKSIGIGGKVFVEFVVEQDGSINKINKLNSVHPLIDAEALRVVNTLPCFKPGSQGDNPVRVLYRIPFNFELRN
jgi:protein TonB